MSTIRDLLLARVGDKNPALAFEDEIWTFDEYVQHCSDRAGYLLANRRPGPFHIGVLLDNVPEYAFWLGAAALCGATIVGINPTRRGSDLARDIRHTNCQLIVTGFPQCLLLSDLDSPVEANRIVDVDSQGWRSELAPFTGSAIPETDDVNVTEKSVLLLIFTSGTSGAPKACICSQGRIASSGSILAQMMSMSHDDVLYCAMPLFHSNALVTNWIPSIAVGATCVLRRKFSASGFVEDVRRYGATYFNYVGKPLAYILMTPELADDADTTLVRGFGNEATDQDIERFEKRFGCRVTDAYGSTEGGVNVSRTEDTPVGSLGRGMPGVAVLNSETGEVCPAARFDRDGRLLNPDEAIGELANQLGATGFEGYWNNDEASVQRTRDGIYWSGDLAYGDADGFIFFAGRDSEWLRVDGENFAAAQVERILMRNRSVALAAVYAVPDEVVGDQVMVTLQLEPGHRFDADSFDAFLEQQADLGTKWAPRYVRIDNDLPMTETNKVLKRVLRSEFWECSAPVWWKPNKLESYRRLLPGDRDDLRREFDRRGRESVLQKPG